MSFSQTITNSINSTVFQFIDSVATKFNLEKTELQLLWNNQTPTQVTITKPQKTTTSNNQELSSMLKPELISLCKSKGLKTTGTKQELIDRLSQQTDAQVSITPKPALVQTTITKPKTTEKQESVVAPVAKALTTNTQILIRRNQFGNHEHPETSLVFDNQTKKVIGKQNENGKIDELTPEDIDVCNQYKFDYVLPGNLNKKDAIKDVKIKELDEEEEEEVEEEMLIEDDDEEEEVEYEEEEEIIE